jgi:multidrug efflux system outer membrane protein
MRRIAHKLAAMLLASVAAGACTVGPDYVKPVVVTPPVFRGQPVMADAGSLADLPWWSVFNDKALQDLITKAMQNNYDIKIAVARIEQARAAVGIAQAQGKLQLNYRGFGGTEQTFVPAPGSAETLNFSTFGAIADAAWEADVWGRIRRATESAQADLLTQEDIRRGVMLTLVSDLAAHYFRLTELDREFAIAQESSKVFKQTLDLFTLRFEAGRDSRLPVDRAQAAYDSSSSRIADLKRAIAQEENAISVLAGDYPKAIDRGLPLVEQSMPETLLGSTTALLQRRPDILAAEANMIGANAEIGLAVADYFPKIGISSLLGGLVAGIGGVWNTLAVWNLAVGAAGPIYSGGRLHETYLQRQAYWDETVATYRKTVLTAFQETSDALVAQQNLIDQRAALERQVAALRRSNDLALDRYDGGRASYFEVLEAQQLLFPAEDALAQTQRDQLLAVVRLYKALGGGWKYTPEQWSRPQ